MVVKSSYIGWVRYILLSVCIVAINFSTYDFFKSRDATGVEQVEDMFKKYIKFLTFPFNIKRLWKCLKSKCPNKVTQPSEKIGANVIQFIAGFCFAILYFVICCITCIFTIISPIYFYFLFWIANRSVRSVASMLLVVIVSSISFFTFLNLMLYWIIGLYLNGSFYGLFVAPLVVFLIYSWKNWRSFVEMKYLTLKTKVYEVCNEFKNKEKSKTPSSTDERSGQDGEENMNDTDVNVKDGKVAKALYEKLREKILPYDNILFCFLVQMFFVGNFCLIVFVMLVLAQKSNIAVPAQIISTMVVSTLPLIFDALWTEHSFEQKHVNAKEVEHKLKKCMEMETKSDNIVTVTIKV